jgi:hypothetical protein
MLPTINISTGGFLTESAQEELSTFFYHNIPRSYLPQNLPRRNYLISSIRISTGGVVYSQNLPRKSYLPLESPQEELPTSKISPGEV